MISGIDELIAVIEVLSENLGLSERKEPPGEFNVLECFLNTRFKVVEDPTTHYPVLEARPYMQEGVIIVPMIDGEDEEGRTSRFSEYQKFFFPTLIASRLALLRELHNWFIASANKRALQEYKKAVNKKMLVEAKEEE